MPGSGLQQTTLSGTGVEGAGVLLCRGLVDLKPGFEVGVACLAG
jgi:hypothetical protein